MGARKHYTCTVDGCGKPHEARGFCSGHYENFRIYGHPLGRAGRKPEGSCETCGRSYGARLRCYLCSPGKRKTGVQRECVTCGKTFYMQRNQVQLTNKGSGKYCSPECRNKAHTGVEIVTGTRYQRGGYMMLKTGLRKYEQEHRVIVAQMIGRPLTRTENVHHRNGDGLDNRPANLELWSVSQPPGQRIIDKVRWAREILNSYGDLFPE